MAVKEEVGIELANLFDSYVIKTYEVKEQKTKLKQLRKEHRELKKEVLSKLKDYRQFI